MLFIKGDKFECAEMGIYAQIVECSVTFNEGVRYALASENSLVWATEAQVIDLQNRVNEANGKVLACEFCFRNEAKLFSKTNGVEVKLYKLCPVCEFNNF